MNAHDPTSAAAGGPGGPAGAPSEEELRAAYEAELARITATDMIAQAAVSLLNIGAHRMGPPPGQGEEPGARRPRPRAGARRDRRRRALLAILERRIPQELAPLQDALSRLQMAYAQEMGAAGPPGRRAGAGRAEAARSSSRRRRREERPEGEPGPGPAESSGRLWVPGR